VNHWTKVLVCVAVASACLVVQVGAVVLGLAIGYLNTKGSQRKPEIVYRYRDRSPLER
jgi:hypothetical protein